MSKYLLAILFWAICIPVAYAQNQHKCATDILLKQKLESDPSIEALYRQQQQTIKENAALAGSNISARTTSSRVIPVVFHVLLNQAQIDQLNGINGINERIVSQLNALNRDFNAKNTDLGNVPAAFRPLIGDMQLTFKLAHRDPQGKSTSGVNVILQNNSVSGFHAGGGNERKTSSGGVDPWDVAHYLNVWVVNITGFGGGVLGFTLSPTNEPLFNQPRRVTLAYGTLGQNFGNQGYFVADADSGRTLVHEVGHFFELLHIWGLTDNCNDDDGIDDTPKQETFNFGCPVFPLLDDCTPAGNGLMFMNYMDYSADRCLLMFTKDQVSRVNASLGSDNKELNESGERTEWPDNINTLTLHSETAIYPNPTTGSFTIVNNGKLQRVVVTNMAGQVITIKNVDKTTSFNIDLSDKAKGIYAVQCQYSEGTVTRKIILQ